MLTLGRRKGESVNVGKDIVVTVTQIRGNQVKLSFSAPADVRIVRGELLRDEGWGSEEEELVDRVPRRF